MKLIFALLVLFFAFSASAGDPGGPYLELGTAPEAESTHEWQFEVRGGPGQVNTAGAAVAIRPTWGHGTRFGLGIDYVGSPDSTTVSQTSSGACTRVGTSPATWWKPRRVECSYSASQSVTVSDNSATLFQVTAGYQPDRPWPVLPFADVGIGTLDDELAWSLAAGGMVQLMPHVSAGLAWRMVDRNVPGPSRHQGLVVLRLNR